MSKLEEWRHEKFEQKYMELNYAIMTLSASMLVIS